MHTDILTKGGARASVNAVVHVYNEQEVIRIPLLILSRTAVLPYNCPDRG